MRYTRSLVRSVYVFASFTVLCVAILFSPQTAAAQASSGRSRIAFVTADDDTREMTLSLVDPDSGQMTTLINEGNFFYPTLSPDGRHVAFLGEHPRSRRQNIYIMGTDGSNFHPIVEGRLTLKPNGQVAWSADSTQIIYGVLSGGRPLGFFRANIDGSGEERMEFPDITGRFVETWIAASPDGTRLAVIAESGADFIRQIFVTDADGNNATPITATFADGQPFDRLTWSPDNQHTLLSALMINSLEPLPLIRGDGDGANAESLITPPPNYITSISWSPNGTQIAFTATEMSSQGIPDGEVYVANADGSGIRALNIPINVSYNGTSWSLIPDDIVLPDTPISFMSLTE